MSAHAPGGGSAEQQARDLLEQCGVEDAQSFSAGDVVALANFIADANNHRRQIERIRTLAATWAVDADSYLHLDGQDLGYADAAVQIIAIIDGERRAALTPKRREVPLP
jgi:hypothetical protein